MPSKSLRLVLIAAVLSYGTLYGIACLASLYDDVANQASMAWVLFNIIIDTLTVTGIVALGIPAIRGRWMKQVWAVFPYLLSLALAFACIVEFGGLVPPPSPIELAVSLGVVSVFIGPAIWMNFRLRRSLLNDLS